MLFTVPLKRIQQISLISMRHGSEPAWQEAVKRNDLKEASQAPPEPLCFWLADDDPAIRTLLAEVLSKDGQLRCAGQFSCAEAVLEALDRETAPEVIVLDINMGGMTGIEAIQPIKFAARSTSVFVMTTFYDSVNESRALNAGASGFFVKTDCHERTAERIRASAQCRIAGPGFEEPEFDCVPALRVSAPGRIHPSLNEAKSLRESSPLILRTFGLLRDFVTRNS
jgi:DNA-binding NarL/FixJ family response regulator